MRGLLHLKSRAAWERRNEELQIDRAAGIRDSRV
jgi:hypothetical protein